MADEYNRLAMYSMPVGDVVNHLAPQLPAGHPSNMLRALRDYIPQVQADDTSTMSGIYSRLGRTATALPRAGLETMANWLEGTHNPNAVRIGEDTIAPLGLFGMAGLAARAPKAAAAADRVWHHGTDAQFDTLQARAAPPYSGGSTVPAVWMTSKPRVAKAFAEAGGQPGRVIDASVNAPNLEVVERGFRSPDWETMDPILQRAKEAGKDGVLFKRSNDHPDSMVVDPRFWNASDVLAMFNPENIKPAQAAPRGPTLLADNAKSSVPGTVVASMTNPGEYDLKFVRDGRELGRARLARESELDRVTAIDDIEVLPEFRRQGIATAIYDEAENIARQKWGRELVSSGDLSPDAQAFWASRNRKRGVPDNPKGGRIDDDFDGLSQLLTAISRDRDGKRLDASPRSSAPGLAANATQGDSDSGVTDILRRYGLLD